MIPPYSTPSPFPPSFEGNPISYGFGLFGDIVAAALALTMLLGYVFESRRNRQATRLLGYPEGHTPTPRWSPLYLYRAANVSMLVFIFMRAAPDALWMLAWGEVSEDAIRALLALDLWGDGLALGPFFFSILCWTWGRQVIPQKLLVGLGTVQSHRPPWEVIWKNCRIILMVLVIAIGVTIGKASA